jgi:outer membrane protein OmpA-like peptidoglycan-associated protein
MGIKCKSKANQIGNCRHFKYRCVAFDYTLGNNVACRRTSLEEKMAYFLRYSFGLFLTGALFFAPASVVSAQDSVTKDGLVRALKAPVTRGISIGNAGPTVKQKSLIRSLATRKTRKITVEERTEITKIIKTHNRPTIDLVIYFDYDSANITPKSIPTLIKLGQALSDKQLKAATFLVAGHTDASGSNDYNLSLSERRANAVKAYLKSNFGLQATGLVAIGYGEEQLKNTADPASGDNRRVQISNLTQ